MYINEDNLSNEDKITLARLALISNVSAKKLLLKDGDTVYSVDYSNNVYKRVWKETKINRILLNTGNIFTSIEDAENFSNKIQTKRLWENLSIASLSAKSSNVLYYIAYDEKLSKIIIKTADKQLICEVMYFSSIEAITVAINEVGENNIIKYIFNKG